MTYEGKKIAHLQRHLGACFISLDERGRVSNYPIDVNTLNFHLQKSLKIFDKN